MHVRAAGAARRVRGLIAPPCFAGCNACTSLSISANKLADAWEAHSLKHDVQTLDRAVLKLIVKELQARASSHAVLALR